MELGFYIGLGLWLTLALLVFIDMDKQTKIDPLKMLLGAAVFLGIPTFWGGVIEWAVS